MERGWNFAAVWQTVAGQRPEAAAIDDGSRILTWGDFATRAGRLARALRHSGLRRQAKLALYLRNRPEYMEAIFGVFRAALVPVNTNYRYGVEEIRHIWDNADVEAVVFQGEFTPLVEELRATCPRIMLWVWVDDGSGPRPEWAVDYQAVCSTGDEFRDGELSGDDLVLIYTGGSTGLPKGVIWRQDDLYLASNATSDPPQADLGHVARRITEARRFPVGLSAAPLMHGTGFVFAATLLSRGGCLVTQPGRRFDPSALLDLIAAKRITDICIVGDAFARPLVEVLDTRPGHWDISCLRVVSSSGMAWSADVKARLLAHAPEALLIDFLNSSEASGMGRSITSAREAPGKGSDPARFRLGTNAFVLDDEGRAMQPGDERVGRLAVRGHIPLGYYKDTSLTDDTFTVVDGKRCSIPGDFARLLSDGTIELLGRGSTVINTGGEKVFVEEVEAAIKTCPGVLDALVVGLPDPRLGQLVAAAVAVRDAALGAGQIVDHVRGRLAAYKAPRHVMIVADVGRTVTGKPDYPAVRRRLVEWLQAAK